MKRLSLTLFAASIMALVFSSCLGYSYISEKKVKAISLNMNKQQIVSVLGTNYQVIALNQDADNVLNEILGYKTSDGGVYKLYLKNDKLVKIDKEWLCSEHDYVEPNNSTTHPTTSINNVSNWGTKVHLDAHRNSMLSTASTDAEKMTINAHMDAHSKTVTGE